MRTSANEPHVRLQDAVLGDEAKEHQTLWQALVWAYRRQCVDVMASRSLLDMERAIDGDVRGGQSGDGVATLMGRGRLGCTIDGCSGFDGVAVAPCHPDAELLHDLVMALSGQSSALIIEYARKGEQPEPSYATPAPLMTHPDLMNADRTLRDKYEVALIDGKRVPYKIISVARERETVPVFEHRGRAGKVQVGTQDVIVDVLFAPIEWWPALGLIDMSNEIHRLWVEAMRSLWSSVRSASFRDRSLTDEGFMVPTATPRPVHVRRPALRQPVVTVDCTPAVAVVDVADESGAPARELRERLARARHVR
ncbi:MAG: hypothetical protein JWO51_161 [Rhodospirillales bacterium]|nr:hypothetical protein [Rhodospirillales bacterium]